ncbi:hypothetical protein ACSBR2_016035 [Camellia fascicularis]
MYSMIVGLAIGSTILVVAHVGFCVCCLAIRNQTKTKEKQVSGQEVQLHEIGDPNKIDGQLPDGREVAVLNPSNVLLDSELNPKILDFGMARIFRGSDGATNTAKIVGTYFGVLLIEIITGRRNANFHLTKRAPSLIAYVSLCGLSKTILLKIDSLVASLAQISIYGSVMLQVWQLWNEGKGLEIIDPLLAKSCNLDEFLRYMHIGLLCVQEYAYDRPSMSSVVVMLKSEVVTLN